ncbi:MAG: hypothetical protein JKY54_07280 [Flavobacteriales bacterium]|nr:hypothetical protein [Flavobacteriales bacterium]
MKVLENYKHLPFTFMGLDFTKSKMVGSHGFNNPSAIRDRLFYSWNLLLHKEKSKFNLQHRLGVNSYYTMFDWNANRNRQVPIEGLVTDYNYELTEHDVVLHVNSYQNVPGHGVGVTFVVESFNKVGEVAVIWVTFFDIASKQVILTTRRVGKPGGMGIRNYWANAIHKVILGL